MIQPTFSPPSESLATRAPSSITREIDRLIGQFHNRLEDDPEDFRRKWIAASSAPAGEERARLEARRAELRSSLGANPGRALHRSIALLLANGRQFGATDPKDHAVRLGLYAEALATMPPWAVEEARLTFGRGGWRCQWDGRDCPSSADVAAECRHILLPIEVELRRLDAVLDAEVYRTGATQDERDRALAHVRGFVAELRQGGAIKQRTDAEIAAEAAEQEQANERFRARDRAHAQAHGRAQAIWGRLPISDELARRIGLPA